MRALAYPVLRRVEPLFLRWARLRNRWPPTFIVGAERSGTTLVCLHVASHHRFGWIPLVAKRRPRYGLTATWRALGSGEWEPNLANDYGVGSGDLAPSDGWDTLQPWFSAERSNSAPREAALPEFVNLVRMYERLFDAPFLNKNNANSTRIAALARAFPGALFIHVKRERCAAVASLMKARRKHGIAVGEWWGTVPPAFATRSFDTELEQAVATHLGAELAASEALRELAPECQLEVDYAQFCAAPDRVSDWLVNAYARVGHELTGRPGASAGVTYEMSRLSRAEYDTLAPDVALIEAALLAEVE